MATVVGVMVTGVNYKGHGDSCRKNIVIAVGVMMIDVRVMVIAVGVVVIAEGVMMTAVGIMMITLAKPV